MRSNPSKSMRRQPSRLQPTRRSVSLASLLAGLLGGHLGMSVAVAGTGALLATAPSALAEGEEGGPSIEEQIKEQMKKIIQLMKDNEKAILEASRGSGKKPEGVQVTPPPAEGSPSKPPEGTPPPEGGKKPEGETPPVKGQDIQKKMDELIKSTQDGGGVIPQELEALIKLIPVSGGQGQSQGGEDPKNKSRNRDLPNPDDPMGKKDEPKDPRKNPDDARGGNKPPPDPEKEKSRQPEVPSWMAELPEETRRAIIGGDTENVPDRYRGLIERYHKWIADQLKERAP